MYTKRSMLLCLCSVALAASMAHAQQKADPWEKVSINLQRIAAETAPLQQYREQVYQIEKPSYETLLPALRALTAYNSQFATSRDVDQKRKLAAELLRPAQTGWNNYRAIDLKEIFENYVPLKGQNDKAIGDLEFFVNLHSLSQEQQNNMRVLQSMIHAAKKFTQQYQAFFNWMQESKEYDEKAIISHLVPMIKEYNKVRTAHPEMIKLIHDSIFKQPVKAGWNRTHTIEGFRYLLGLDWYAGGDAYEYRSAARLQALFGVSLEEGEAFSHFVSRYNRVTKGVSQTNLRLLENMPTVVGKFMESYNDFRAWAEETSAYNAKEVIVHLIPMIKEHNALRSTHPEVISLIRTSLFEQSFEAGWNANRLYSILALRNELGGLDYDSDGYDYYTGKQMQDKYGLTAEDGELFAQFVKQYYK